MNLHISGDAERIIRLKLQSGRFASESADPTGLQVLKKCRVSGRGRFCPSYFFSGKGMREWTLDRRPGKWISERKTPSTQVPRGAKQIVIPMTQQQYDDIWHDADRVRSFIEQCTRSAPELFPAGFDQGYCLHGFGRESLKLSGLKLRKIVLANGTSYWLRPSFVTSYMTGTVDQLAYPLLLAAHDVPFWLLTLGFGHNDMFWYRLIERLGRNSLDGNHRPQPGPVALASGGGRASRRLGEQKGYVATTVGEGCVGRRADGLGR